MMEVAHRRLGIVGQQHPAPAGPGKFRRCLMEVGQHHPGLALPPPQIDIQVGVVGQKLFKAAAGQDGLFPSQADQRLVIVKDRVRVLQCLAGVDAGVVGG